jgi:hypothetical protein
LGLIRLEFDLGSGKIEFMVEILRARTVQNKPKLLDQVRDTIRRRHFSIRTEEAYTNWIRRFILFHGKRHPRDMAEAEVTEFLTQLAREGRVAGSTQNQARAAGGHRSSVITWPKESCSWRSRKRYAHPGLQSRPAATA